MDAFRTKLAVDGAMRDDQVHHVDSAGSPAGVELGAMVDSCVNPARSSTSRESGSGGANTPCRLYSMNEPEMFCARDQNVLFKMVTKRPYASEPPTEYHPRGRLARPQSWMAAARSSFASTHEGSTAASTRNIPPRLTKPAAEMARETLCPYSKRNGTPKLPALCSMAIAERVSRQGPELATMARAVLGVTSANQKKDTSSVSVHHTRGRDSSENDALSATAGTPLTISSAETPGPWLGIIPFGGNVFERYRTMS